MAIQDTFTRIHIQTNTRWKEELERRLIWRQVVMMLMIMMMLDHVLVVVGTNAQEMKQNERLCRCSSLALYTFSLCLPPPLASKYHITTTTTTQIGPITKLVDTHAGRHIIIIDTLW